ncbi:MAG: hypothetical protein GX358_10020 [candidate division WS1 bacterium]|nr:hypothetical protein [candidate division WS1 bacterium]
MPNLRSRRWAYAYALVLLSFLTTAIIPTVALAGPMVQIVQPTQGQTVTGVIWIDVSYSTDTDAPIATLELYINDQLARRSNLASPEKAGTRSFQWDFSTAAASTHTISAKAIDTEGAAGMATIAVAVRRAEAVARPGTHDTIPPTINIYYPAHGAKVSDTVEIQAEARDDVGVEAVYFYIDGRLHKMIYNNPPYYAHWDTTRETDGNHVLEAVAVDAAGNEGKSAQVTVIVENHSMTRMELPDSSDSSLQPMAAAEMPIAAAPELIQPEATAPTPVVPATQAQSEIPAPPMLPEPPAIAAQPEILTAPGAEPTTVAVEPRSTASSAVAPATPAQVAVSSSSGLGGQFFALAPTAAGVSGDISSPRATSPARSTSRATHTMGHTVMPSQSVGPSAPAHGTLAVDRKNTETRPALALAAFSAATVDRAAVTAPYATDSLQVAYADTAAGTLAPRTSIPQVTALPQDALPAAAALDASIPELRLVTHVAPAATTPAQLLPQRTSGIGSAAYMQEIEPAISASEASSRPASGALALAPRTSAPTASRPAVPELAPAVAKSPVQDISIVFDGTVLDLRAAPETIDGIATGPLRELFERSDGVLYWFPATKEVRAIGDGVDLHLNIGDPTVQVNGVAQQMSLAPYIKQGRTMLPLQFIADMMDLSITYEPDTKQIVISSNSF